MKTIKKIINFVIYVVQKVLLSFFLITIYFLLLSFTKILLLFSPNPKYKKARLEPESKTYWDECDITFDAANIEDFCEQS